MTPLCARVRSLERHPRAIRAARVTLVIRRGYFHELLRRLLDAGMSIRRLFDALQARPLFTIATNAAAPTDIFAARQTARRRIATRKISGRSLAAREPAHAPRTSLSSHSTAVNSTRPVDAYAAGKYLARDMFTPRTRASRRGIRPPDIVMQFKVLMKSHARTAVRVDFRLSENQRVRNYGLATVRGDKLVILQAPGNAPRIITVLTSAASQGRKKNRALAP